MLFFKNSSQITSKLTPNLRYYESLTVSGYKKWVQPSLLLRAPQDAIGDLSLMESFILALCYTALPLLSTWKVYR